MGTDRLSEHERAVVCRVARVALPQGTIFRGADAASVERLEAHIAFSDGLLAGYRALVRLLELAALVRYGRRLHLLDDERLLRLLEDWRQGDYLRRVAVRLLTAPLKAAHYHAADMYRAVGCRFSTLPVVDEPPRVVRERVHRLEDFPSGEEIECDVVVVGTGAGGAVAAKKLAERGLAVVLLEEGAFHRRSEFTGHGLEMQRRLYRNAGAVFSVGNVAIPIPIGQGVGGSTIINSGTCYRTPPWILRRWRKTLGLSELTEEELAPHFEEVESVLRVEHAQPNLLGGSARVVARGCEALGYHRHGPLRRNAPDCDGQGVCCFGCPTDAKRSTNVSYVPLALASGAQLFTGAAVEHILVQRGRAVGVVARNGRRHLTVRAHATVLACGSLLTPVLLDANGLCGRSGHLGRHLSIHPAVATMAIFDEVIDGANAIPQGYAIEEFHEEGLLFEGAFAPLDIGAASLPLLGPRLVALLEQFRHVACFGVMLEDTSRGRVLRARGARPFIHYVVNDHDVARLKRGVEILARIFFAAGARTVLPLVHGFDEFASVEELARFRRARLRARDFELSAYHPLGTARMAPSRERGVVDQRSQAFELPGLYIMDGSVVPSSPAVNPQVTIMALASRSASLLADKLGRTGL